MSDKPTTCMALAMVYEVLVGVAYFVGLAGYEFSIWLIFGPPMVACFAFVVWLIGGAVRKEWEAE